MKRSGFLIFILCVSLSLSSQKDSLKFANFRGIYFNTYFANYLGGSYIDPYQKFPNDGDDYHYDIKRYSFQAPAIGIGYVINWNGFFIKTDFNYRYGKIDLDEVIVSKWTIDDKFISPPWPGSSPMAIGTRYYKNIDRIKGYMNVSSFDVSFVLSGNITRNFRIYHGFRWNCFTYYSFNATMNRESSLYEVVAWTSAYTSKDSLISTGYQRFENKEAKDKSIYTLSKKSFFDVGLCYNFRIRKQLFIAEVQYETNHFPVFLRLSYGGWNYSSFTVKLAHVFKYSRYFGKG